MEQSAHHGAILEFQQLCDCLLGTGETVKNSVNMAIRSLANRETELARHVLAGNEKIAFQTSETDAACFSFIVRYQPEGELLRNIAAIIHMMRELRQIAEVSSRIADLGLKLSSLPKPLVDIPRMGETVAKMIDTSLLAFARKDQALAHQVVAMDAMLDDLERQIFRELFLMIMENPKIMERANQLMIVSRLLERAGEHAINLSEQVVEMITGKGYVSRNP